MSYKEVSCRNCGAKLEIDGIEDKITCPYCGTLYIDDENNDSESKLLGRGLKQIEMKSYGDAELTFRKITQLYPGSYKGWLGLCVVASGKGNPIEEREKKNTLSQCPEQLRESLYGANVYSQIRIDKICKDIEVYQKRIESLGDTINNYKKAITNVNSDSSRNILLRLGGIGLLIIGFLMISTGGQGDNTVALMGIVVFAFGIFLVTRKKNYHNPKSSNTNSYNRIYETEKEIESVEKTIKELEKKLILEKKFKPEQYYIEIMRK